MWSMQLVIEPLGSGHGFNVSGCDEYGATAEGIEARLGACVSPLESYRCLGNERGRAHLNF